MRPQASQTPLFSTPHKALGFVRRAFARPDGAAQKLPWLLSLLLVLQLFGASMVAPQGVRTQTAADLATLGAAIGQPVPLCIHGDPGDPAPSAPDRCDHCVLCHVTDGGPALPPGPFVLVAPEPIAAITGHPPAAAPALAARHADGHRPRGPPSLA